MATPSDDGVLSGRRVVDLSSMIAGPYAGMLLGDLGADVVKVEVPAGDPARGLGPPVVGRDSAAFHSVNRNKRSVTIDLTSPDGAGQLDALLADADVVIHNSLPRIATALGISGPSLLERHPKLVIVEIGGFSPRGPDADRPAYDIIIAAMSGLMSVTGEVSGGPLRPGSPMIDTATGAYAAMGALGALLARERTGRGQVVSVAMIDVAVNLQATNFAYYFATGAQPPRKANGSYFAISNCFPTKDSWLAVAVGSDPLWQRLVAAIGDPALADPRWADNQSRLRAADEIEVVLSAHFPLRTTDEWHEILETHRVPHAPILDYEAVVDQLGAASDNILWSFDRDDTGTVPVIGNPLFFSESAVGLRLPPPHLGQDDLGDSR